LYILPEGRTPDIEAQIEQDSGRGYFFLVVRFPAYPRQ
jgi:hypothetical protein